MYEYKIVRDNSLIHYNKNHGYHGWFAPGDGDGDGQTEYQDSLRRKTDSEAARARLDSYYKNEGKSNYKSAGTKKMGTSYSTNPYVDKNGKLTDAGKRRYDAELKANHQKPKDKRASDDALLDPNKWVKDDLKAMQGLAVASKEASEQTSKLLDQIFKTKPNARLDLSKMSDQELRNILNREQLERQYNDVFNKPQENKGKEYVKKALEINSTLAATAVAGLTIAVLIKTLAAPAAAAII